MRVLNWDWKRANQIVATNSLNRARKAARVLAAKVRQNCPVGTISHPIYRTGPYAGQKWTSRDAGRLKKSVRVVERNSQKYGFDLSQYANIGLYGNIRIYAGHYMAWYARIVEFYTPFMRSAVTSTKSKIKSILENG